MEEEKKRILDEVTENETYKKAKEILMKFAPDQLKMTPVSYCQTYSYNLFIIYVAKNVHYKFIFNCTHNRLLFQNIFRQSQIYNDAPKFGSPLLAPQLIQPENEVRRRTFAIPNLEESHSIKKVHSTELNSQAALSLTPVKKNGKLIIKFALNTHIL